MPVGDLMQLQRTIGNKALGTLLVQSPPQALVQRGKKKRKTRRVGTRGERTKIAGRSKAKQEKEETSLEEITVRTSTLGFS